MGTEARNGSFGAHHIAAGHSEAFGVQGGELRGGGGRQIFCHNQTIVEYHKAVVGLLKGQQIRGHWLAMPVEFVCISPVNHHDVTIGMNRHAARPHGAALKPWRAFECF